MITGALQGALGGDITKVLANRTASYFAEAYLAEAIKKTITNLDGSVNIEVKIAAHAILGSLLSQADGNNSLAGGLGASVQKQQLSLPKTSFTGINIFLGTHGHNAKKPTRCRDKKVLKQEY